MAVPSFLQRLDFGGLVGFRQERNVTAAGGLMPSAAEEAHEAEEVSEVVPGAIVVDVIDVQVFHEQREQEDEWGDEALPEAEPESGDGIAWAVLGCWGRGHRRRG